MEQSTTTQDIVANEDTLLTAEICINLLIQAVLRGQARGAYSLEESETILKSIRFLQKNK